MVSENTEEEPLALRLARYLREFVGLRTTTVRDIEKYEAVVWFHPIPQERESQTRRRTPTSRTPGSNTTRHWLAS